MTSKIFLLINLWTAFISGISAQSTGDYRTIQTGVWSAISTWQTFNGTNWVNATSAPSSSNGVITILASHTITSNGAVTADQLVINSDGILSVTAGTFTLNDTTGIDLVCNGTVNLANGSLTGAGTINFNTSGTFNWSGGTNGGTGIMNINAGAIFNMNGGTLSLGDTKTLNNYGAWNWTSGNFNYSSSAPVVNNYGTFNINTDNDVNRNSVNTGSFSNMPSGIINKIGDPSDQTYFVNIGSFTNAGVINVNSGRFQLNVNSVNTGTIKVAFGAVMSYSAGNALFNAGSVLTGDGTFSFEAGRDTIYAGTVSAKNIYVSNSSTILSIIPTLTMGNGSVVNLSGGLLSGTGILNFNAGSAFNWTGGYLAGRGITNINAGATLTMNGSALYLADTATLNNYGTCNWTSGWLYYNNGAPVLNNYGSFNISTDYDITQSGTNTGSFNNRSTGIINKIGSPGEETYITGLGNFTNAGVINVNSSQLRLNANSVNTGTINLAFGANMNYSAGNALFNSGSVLNGDGTLNFSGGHDTIYAALVAVKNINVSGANTIVSISSTLSMATGSTITLSAGLLSGTGIVNFNSGSIFNWTGGYLAGKAIFNINPGAVFNMNGSAMYFADTATINNRGTWNWTNGWFYYNNGAPVANNYGIFNISTDYDLTQSGTNTGLFSNKPTGVINKIGSPSDETYFTNIISFTNEGTINVNSSQLRLNANSFNTGIINVALGATMAYSAGNALFRSGSALNGAGTFNFSGGKDTIYAGAITAKNINVTNGNTVLNIVPRITMNAGYTLNLSGGLLSGLDTMNFNSGSAFNWTGGYLAGKIILNINAGANLNMNGGSLYFADTSVINNRGIWNWNSGNIFYNNGAPVANNYGVLNINTDNDLNRSGVNTGSFNNMPTGIINKIGSPSDETFFGNISSFNNAGTINVNTGNLTLNVNGSHNGAYKIAFGSQLGGSIPMSYTGSSFINDGSVTVTSLSFADTAVQLLYGTGSINTFIVNNAKGIILGGSQNINNALVLTSGKITLGDNNLSLISPATFTGGDSVNYIITNGTGAFQRRVLNNNANVLFPVGSENSYRPVTIQLTNTSVADDFKVRSLPDIYGAYDTTNNNTIGSAMNSNSVKGSWNIQEKVPGGSLATVALQWKAADEFAGFNRAASRFAQYASGKWTTDTAKAASGTNPFTLNRTGISSFSFFGITNQFITVNNNYAAICAGGVLKIPYNAAGTFNAGNVFTAQLSNAAGSFSAPVSIGSITSGASGLISATIPGATLPGTGYRLRVVSSAPSLVSPENPGYIAVRNCAVVPPVLVKKCAPPSGLAVINFTPSTVQLSWNEVSFAGGYQLQLRRKSSPEWSIINVDTTTLIIDTLQSNTAYEVIVRSKCSNAFSAFSGTLSFTTLNFGRSLISGRLAAQKLLVYPNPTNGQFRVQIKTKGFSSGYANIQLMNTTGQVIHSERILVSGHELNKTISFSPEITNGIYIMTIFIGSEMFYSKINYQRK